MADWLRFLIERGDPRVAVGTWATVLFVLGLVDRLADVAAPIADDIGLSLEAERLPKRVHLKSRRHPRETVPKKRDRKGDS